MSCNGCRILRKGCSDNCILRHSLHGISSPQAQANATLFVAKFFGRAGLISFLSSVPAAQRPALFQSLLFEACGRTVNPVHGAVGLLWTGNWHVCQAAVETVLRGGALHAQPPDFSPESDSASETNNLNLKLEKSSVQPAAREVVEDLDLGLSSSVEGDTRRKTKKRRGGSPSTEESEITTSESGCVQNQNEYHHSGNDAKVLRLFF